MTKFGQSGRMNIKIMISLYAVNKTQNTYPYTAVLFEAKVFFFFFAAPIPVLKIFWIWRVRDSWLSEQLRIAKRGSGTISTLQFTQNHWNISDQNLCVLVYNTNLCSTSSTMIITLFISFIQSEIRTFNVILLCEFFFIFQSMGNVWAVYLVQFTSQRDLWRQKQGGSLVFCQTLSVQHHKKQNKNKHQVFSRGWFSIWLCPNICFLSTILFNKSSSTCVFCMKLVRYMLAVYKKPWDFKGPLSEQCAFTSLL